MIYFQEQLNSDVISGGKARALASLSLARFNVPEWFIISPEAFYQSLPATIVERWQDITDIAELQQALSEIRINSDFAEQLSNAMSRLCNENELVAVRSSAADEDGAEHSFAGQLESYLFVNKHELQDRVIKVWQSGFSDRIFTYRQENNLSMPPPAPAVLVQKMINADTAGVAFSADPVSGRRSVSVIGAVYGLGSALVSGEADADTYHVDRNDHITERTIANKQRAHAMEVKAEEGVALITIDDIRAKKSALTDEQIKLVANLVRACERHFGCPQDIEWAFKGSDLYLLQSRPITSIAEMADPDANLTIWDNSNIAESYRGVTTPLTFTFASRAYESVYREFCRMMRVPKKVIEAHDATFARMLGLVKGHVYYNLISWYEVLAMLPGFKMNRQFMEQMMGVKEPMPEEVIRELVPESSTWQKVTDALRLLSTVTGLIANHFVINRRIKKFYQRFNTAMQETNTPLSQMRPDELVEYYHGLEQQLLKRWDAPLVNDFFAMIFYGVLRKLTEKWCDDKDGSLQNDLLVGEGDIISAEPAQRIRRMAEMVFLYPEFVDVLAEGSIGEIYRKLPEYREFYLSYQAYLEKFGDRCLDELKLESPTLHDNPLPVLRSIGHMARRIMSEPEHDDKQEKQQRHLAEDHVKELIAGHPLRNMIFKWVLKHARARVSDRENLRFERTRLFGRVRKIFIELGNRLRDLTVLNDPRDIFYLELDEIINYAEGKATTQNLAALVRIRKAEFSEFENSSAPADRFETRGIIYHGHDFKSVKPARVIEGDEIKGTGCCPGVIRGQVRVVRDPRGVELKQGEILVAERTDPGWIMLFPAAAGLLVEHGSLLSHSAIVAREMGIPAIVALAGVTEWLQDGDWVEMDGRQGIVRKVTDQTVDMESVVDPQDLTEHVISDIEE